MNIKRKKLKLIISVFLNRFFFSSSICRWYFRKIKRIEAEKKLLLPENEHGAFLIRDSESRHNDYSLSGKCFRCFFTLKFWLIYPSESCDRWISVVFSVSFWMCVHIIFSAWRRHGQTLSYSSIGRGWILHRTSHNIQVISKTICFLQLNLYFSRIVFFSSNCWHLNCSSFK